MLDSKRKIELETQYIHFVFSLLGQHHYPGHVTLDTPHVHRFDMGGLLETFKDRDIEFIAFRNLIRGDMHANYGVASTYTKNDITTTCLEFGTRSCETLCEDLVGIVADNLPEGYPTAEIQVMVQESEEQAAGVWKGKILAP